MDWEEYTLILAEDDDELRSKLFFSLIKEGFNVIQVANGYQLYLVASDYAGDLSKLIIISDTDMPELKGDKACERLLKNEEYKKSIMIGMSAEAENEEYWKGITIKDSFIYKNRFPDLSPAVFERIKNIFNNRPIYQLKDNTFRR